MDVSKVGILSQCIYNIKIMYILNILKFCQLYFKNAEKNLES